MRKRIASIISDNATFNATEGGCFAKWSKWPPTSGGKAGGCQGQWFWVAAAKQPWIDPGEAPNISHRESWRTDAELIALASCNGNTGFVFLVSSSLDQPKSRHEPGRTMLGALETGSMT